MLGTFLAPRCRGAVPHRPRGPRGWPPRSVRLHDSASPAGPARWPGATPGAPKHPANRRRADRDDGGIRGGSGGRDGAPRRWLGGEAERRQEPVHRIGFGRRTDDSARPPQRPQTRTELSNGVNLVAILLPLRWALGDSRGRSRALALFPDREP